MDEFSTDAFVLRNRAFGESDSIVVLLTDKLGKLSAIAKGARRSKKRFAGGALEPFQILRMRISKRPHASLYFLHESRVVRTATHVSADVDVYAWASYITELTERMTVDVDPCPDLFELYSETISRLAPGNLEPETHHFILGLLDRSGWGPDFGSCGLCAEQITEYSRPILDRRGSGVVCSKHEAENLGIDANDPDFRPSRRVIEPELLSYVQQARYAPTEPPSAEIRSLGTKLLDRLVDLHLTKPPVSRAFLLSLETAPAAPAHDNGDVNENSP